MSQLVINEPTINGEPSRRSPNPRCCNGAYLCAKCKALAVVRAVPGSNEHFQAVVNNAAIFDSDILIPPKPIESAADQQRATHNAMYDNLWGGGPFGGSGDNDALPVPGQPAPQAAHSTEAQYGNPSKALTGLDQLSDAEKAEQDAENQRRVEGSAGLRSCPML